MVTMAYSRVAKHPFIGWTPVFTPARLAGCCHVSSRGLSVAGCYTSEKLTMLANSAAVHPTVVIAGGSTNERDSAEILP